MVALRILSILFDLILAFFLFYRPINLKSLHRKSLLLLLLVLGFHMILTFFFVGAEWFLGVNLILNLLESYLVTACLKYRVIEVSFWILCQTLLSLLAGAVFNQILDLFLPLSSLSLSPIFLVVYVLISWFLTFFITLGLRPLFKRNRLLFSSNSLETPQGARFYLSIVPSLSIFFAFIILAIQGQVFGKDYLPFVSLISLIVLGVSSLYSTLHFFQQQRKFYSSRLESEQLKFQMREMKRHQEDYETLQRMRHDLRNSQLTALSLLEKNPDQAKNYLVSLTQASEGIGIFYAKNPTINFLLNQKLQPVETEITLEVNCFVPEELGIEPEIIAVILGNLLDNSIAASLRLSNQDQRFLSLTLRYFQQTLFLSLENAFDETELRTRSHRQVEGWGLKNIDSLVYEYQGTIQRFVAEGRYRTEVVLPM